jgi:ABC-type nickel/cobalt efflux system permease component RcnA
MNAEGEFTNPFDQGGNRNCLTFWGCARAAAMRDMSLTLKPPTAHQLFKHDIRARLEAQSGDEATSLRESSNATNHCTRWIEQRCAACSRHSHSHSHHGGSCSHGHSHGVSPAPAPETVVVHDEKVEDDTCGPNENELLLSPVDKRRD